MGNFHHIGSHRSAIDQTTPAVPAKKADATSPLTHALLKALNSCFPGDQIKALNVVWGKEEKSLAGFAQRFDEIKKDFLGKAPASPAGQDPDVNFRLFVTKQISQKLGSPLEEQIRHLLDKHGDASMTSNPDQPALFQKELGLLLDKMQEALVPMSGIDLTQCLEAAGLGPAKPDASEAYLPSQSIILHDAAITQLPAAVSGFHNHVATAPAQLPAQPIAAPAAPKISPAIAHKQAMLAALDCFPDTLKNKAAFHSVKTAMDVYSGAMKTYRGAAQNALIARHPDAIAAGVASIKIYSHLRDKKAQSVAFGRDLVNIEMGANLSKFNLAALGCKESKIRSSKEARRPGNAVSIAMRAPVQVASGRVARPVILSVAAPALDTHVQPEWHAYVKGTKLDRQHHLTNIGKLDTNAYKKAMQALSAHIQQCAQDHPGHRVVLSGYGLNNFIKALSAADQVRAKDVGMTEMAKLIDALAARGIAVAFTGLDRNDPIFTGIQAKTTTTIMFTGAIPQDWIQDTDMIVNAWDPHSLAGNGCAQDNSMDGFVGRSSLTHEIHAAACKLYSEGLLSEVNNTL